jgi:hypothetical protein
MRIHVLKIQIWTNIFIISKKIYTKVKNLFIYTQSQFQFWKLLEFYTLSSSKNVISTASSEGAVTDSDYIV